jgi:hypothetical protein
MQRAFLSVSRALQWRLNATARAADGAGVGVIALGLDLIPAVVRVGEIAIQDLTGRAHVVDFLLPAGRPVTLLERGRSARLPVFLWRSPDRCGSGRLRQANRVKKRGVTIRRTSKKGPKQPCTLHPYSAVKSFGVFGVGCPKSFVSV